VDETRTNINALRSCFIALLREPLNGLAMNRKRRKKKRVKAEPHTIKSLKKMKSGSDCCGGWANSNASARFENSIIVEVIKVVQYPSQFP